MMAAQILEDRGQEPMKLIITAPSQKYLSTVRLDQHILDKDFHFDSVEYGKEFLSE